MLQSALEGPFALAACFEEDVFMLPLNPAGYAASFFEAKPDHEQVFAEITKFHTAALAIGRKAYDRCDCGCVPCSPLLVSLPLRLALSLVLCVCVSPIITSCSPLLLFQ